MENLEILSPSIDDLSNHYGWSLREKQRVEQLVKESTSCKVLSLPIEDTTILSPNEVIECYRKSYREGYLTPSMFLEKLNQLVKVKTQKNDQSFNATL